jgi:hypothetical protein
MQTNTEFELPEQVSMKALSNESVRSNLLYSQAQSHATCHMRQGCKGAGVQGFHVAIRNKPGK